jgi:hypothetical protein
MLSSKPGSHMGDFIFTFLHSYFYTFPASPWVSKHHTLLQLIILALLGEEQTPPFVTFSVLILHTLAQSSPLFQFQMSSEFVSRQPEHVLKKRSSELSPWGVLCGEAESVLCPKPQSHAVSVHCAAYSFFLLTFYVCYIPMHE